MLQLCPDHKTYARKEGLIPGSLTVVDAKFKCTILYNEPTPKPSSLLFAEDGMPFILFFSLSPSFVLLLFYPRLSQHLIY